MRKFQLIFLCLFLLTGCHKDPDNTINTAGLRANVDNKSFNPGVVTATYFSKWHQLHIKTEENGPYLLFGINLDSNAPVKNYLLESNGNNIAELQKWYDPADGQFDTDHNLTDVGGNFKITEFDTIQKFLSANFQFIAYSQSRAKRIVVSDGVIEHIPVTIDTTAYNGSYASCTVNGVVPREWYSKNIYAHIDCRSNGIERLQIWIGTIIGGYAQNRFLELNVPLAEPLLGAHPMDVAAIFPCQNMLYTSGYYVNNYDAKYFATSGTITILSIDTAQKKIVADFNISYQDKVPGRNEIINISNGHLQLNYWRHF